MKHTAGPWKAEEWDYPTATAPHKDLVIVGDEFRIAVLDRDTTGDNPYTITAEQAQANARLIAAAPDMLEALKYVVKYHRDHDSGEGELYGLDHVTTCIAAIAKATK